jgi:hypothetical protein
MGFFSSLFGRGDKTPPKVPPTETVGVSGTPIYGGYIQSNEKNAALVGTKKFETYSNIVANTAIVGAGVRLFLNLVAKPTWKVVPADDSPEAQILAEKVDFILHDMSQPWHAVVRTAARYRFYGFSVQEWTAKKMEDGTIGLLDVEARPQYTIEQWNADRTGTVAGVVQHDPATGETHYLPRQKIVYMVDNSLSDSPEGVGLLRHCADSVRHLVRLEQLEGFGYESDLGGVPVGRAPVAKLNKAVNDGDITAAERDALLKGLRDFVSNRIRNPSQGLVLDSLTYMDQSEAASPSSITEWGVEILTGDGTSSVGGLDTSVKRLNMEIARVLGVEHLMLGGDSAGSLALGRVKITQFAALVEGTLSELAWSFEHDLLERLRQLNGWPPERMPSLLPGSIQIRDVQEVAETLALLAQAGAPLMPGDPAVDEVREQLKLSPTSQGAMAVDAALLGTSATEEQPLAGADGTAAAGATAPGEAVQQTAFNGAQVTAMVDIVRAVQAGEIDRQSAIEVVATMFPVTRNQAVAIIDGTDRKPNPVAAPAQPRILTAPPPTDQPAEAPGETDTGDASDEEMEAAVKMLRKVVTHDAKGWHVWSKDRRKHLGGPYKTEAQAITRLIQVEGHKAAGPQNGHPE